MGREAPPAGGSSAARFLPCARRVAFAFAWVVFLITVVLAWRKVMSVPDGRGDVTGLSVATVAGAVGLLLLDTDELAEDLHVDERTVQARINALTPAELDYIERRLAAKDGAA